MIALSTLGRRSYISFWSTVIARYILACPPRRIISARTISATTHIHSADVIVALNDMAVLEKERPPSSSSSSSSSVKNLRRQPLIINKAKVRSWASRNRVALNPIVESTDFRTPEPVTRLTKLDSDDDDDGDGDGDGDGDDGDDGDDDEVKDERVGR